MKKLLFTLILLFPCTAFANPVRLERLTSLYENFEAGFAYLHHCGDFKAHLTEHPFYMANVQSTVVALAGEIHTERPNVSEEDAGKMIIARSNKIQDAFNEFYKTNKCDSTAALAAKKQLDMFQDRSPDTVTDFLKNIENK
jgi:hypothetical protein